MQVNHKEPQIGSIAMTDAERRERALAALALSRRSQLPLGAAAPQVGLTPEEVLFFAAEGFELHGDDWLAKEFDRIPREMGVLTEDGPQWILTRDSRLASRLGVHANAVRYYLEIGDPSWLHPITLRVGSRTMRLASDPQTIDRLAEGGEIHLEAYRR